MLVDETEGSNKPLWAYLWATKVPHYLDKKHDMMVSLENCLTDIVQLLQEHRK